MGGVVQSWISYCSPSTRMGRHCEPFHPPAVSRCSNTMEWEQHGWTSSTTFRLPCGLHVTQRTQPLTIDGGYLSTAVLGGRPLESIERHQALWLLFALAQAVSLLFAMVEGHLRGPGCAPGMPLQRNLHVSAGAVTVARKLQEARAQVSFRRCRMFWHTEE